MGIEVRAPTDEEWPAVCRVDGRAFGHHYSAQDIEDQRPVHDMSRFRIALDGTDIVSVAGSYALDVTLPGGASVPMGGVTWVSTAATHRRQGLMRRTVEAVHDDIDARGEPVASLYASEGSIYEHLGYGIATVWNTVSIDRASAHVRPEFVVPSGSVRYIEGDEVVPILGDLWERFRRQRAGECARTDLFQQFIFDRREKEQDGHTPAHYLHHRDGYACYRIEPNWTDDGPAHTLHLNELVAVSPEADAALWQALLGVDLVATIKTRVLPIDTTVRSLFENPRVVKLTQARDGVWVNVRDIQIAFGARTYRTTDAFVVEVDRRRWGISGGPDGASVRAVRTRADLVTTHPALSSLLYGGTLPSALVAGKRMTARSTEVLDRADMFFPTTVAPHCQSFY